MRCIVIHLTGVGCCSFARLVFYLECEARIERRNVFVARTPLSAHRREHESRCIIVEFVHRERNIRRVHVAINQFIEYWIISRQCINKPCVRSASIVRMRIYLFWFGAASSGTTLTCFPMVQLILFERSPCVQVPVHFHDIPISIIFVEIIFNLQFLWKITTKKCNNNRIALSAERCVISPIQWWRIGELETRSILFFFRNFLEKRCRPIQNAFNPFNGIHTNWIGRLFVSQEIF